MSAIASRRVLLLAAWLVGALPPFAPAGASAGQPSGGVALAPTALVAAPDGNSLFVACASAQRVLRLDLQTRRVVATFKLPAPPSGLAISGDGSVLFVTCAAPDSRICVVDLARGKTVDQIHGGHTTMAPVLCPDNQTLLVCNRFNNDVSVIDLHTQKETGRIAVQREPVAATLAGNGKYLLVANALPTGRDDTDTVAAVVSVMDWKTGRVAKALSLPDGSMALNDIQASPDGNYALVTHILARYHLPTIEIERGWINANALTIIDLHRLAIINTVLLDEMGHGAANPWGIAWSADSRTAVVAHAGTHEISVIDFPMLLQKLAKLPAKLTQPLLTDYGTAARVQADVPNDLTFLAGVRQRVKLPGSDRGPRAAVMIRNTAYVANYFSDTLTAVTLFPGISAPETIPLGPKPEFSEVRQGELDFNDASLCLQGWQSCASCHPGDARTDALNWDLPNDGIGNPKNTRSLLLADRTPPAMSLGVRADLSAAVQAGLQNILFTHPRPEVTAAIETYIKSLKPVPSPHLVDGKRSKSARRGEKLFSKAGCVECHVPGLYTDLRSHNVGTRAAYDGPADKFYTPTLIEVWRTAPYLHNGSAATVRDVLTICNQNGLHGDESGLSSQDLDDLCAFVLSL